MTSSPLGVALRGAATTALDLGVEVAAHYGDPAAEYAALRESTGVVDRSARGVVVVQGADARSFLSGLVSADVDTLRDGEGAHSLLLQPQGRLTADFRLLRIGAGEWWLDAEPGFGAVLAEGLLRFRLRVDAEVDDRSDGWGVVSLLGPGADALVEVLAGFPLGVAHEPAAPEPAAYEHIAWRASRMVRAGWPGIPGIDVVGPIAELDAAWSELVAAGATRVGLEAAEAVRVEVGVPRQGHDLDDSTIAQEAFLERDAVSFTKGCFLGQELVSRIDARGHVNRFLRGLRLAGTVPAGSVLRAGDREVGRLTSIAVSPRLGPVGLAMVRREVEPGGDVEVEGGGVTVGARVEELPLVG